MRVLIFSTDRKLLDRRSGAFERHQEYARAFDALDILVLGGRGGLSQGSVQVYGVGAGVPLFRGLTAFFKSIQLARPDIITVQDPFENGLIAWVIAWWKNVPLHVQVHTDFLRKEFAQHSLANRARRMIAGFVLPRAARIRVVSDCIKDSLQAAGYKLPAISVLPIFVDIEKYAGRARTKHDRFKIALLWVGRLEKEKDPLFAIQILEIVRKMGHDAGLTIVGSGQEEDQLRQYVRARGMERFVDFKGWQDDLRQYFCVADILLVTSHYEGYGMAMIEALAAGVPVLSTDVGVAQEAGAMVSRRKEMGRALLDWIAHGPRKGELHSYPYTSRDEYVRAWCDDIRNSHLG